MFPELCGCRISKENLSARVCSPKRSGCWLWRHYWVLILPCGGKNVACCFFKGASGKSICCILKTVFLSCPCTPACCYPPAQELGCVWSLFWIHLPRKRFPYNSRGKLLGKVWFLSTRGDFSSPESLRSLLVFFFLILEPHPRIFHVL